MDKDWYQTAPNLRIFSVFMSSKRQYFRKVRAGFRSLFRKWGISKGKGKGELNPFAAGGMQANPIYQIFLYHSLMNMIFQYVADGFLGLLGDDEEEDE